MPYLYIFIVIAANAIQSTLASSGDRDSLYLNCLQRMARTRCSSTSQPETLSFFLELLRWSCHDNIKYECMHAITDYRIKDGQKVLQYYGKWPFTRFMGMQEPASVLFSLIHLYTCWIGFRNCRERIRSRFPLKRAYLFCTIAGMHAWLWSALFHARDRPWTEKGDYFAGAFSIIVNTVVCIARVFDLSTTGFGILLAVSILYFVFHVLYLTSGPFDYGYNVASMAIWGIIGCMTWLGWYWRHYKRYYAWRAGVVAIGLPLCMSLEVWDFPPWKGVLDAHAIWHGITWPFGLLLYEFFIVDANYESTMLRND
ncbi:hypothetical protein SmJEL517_g05661 [Synchytrium microbalum]|uniref:Post-GPI attachment to proteins factor 3 n=1 Tax=Synchytrium microbalum TaxID=1806994 RepID=A0A507BUC1_9FUNG|nr:uncharacterized protein SmJEL517_g05661 [Synchytrium microbalum]TPX30888.1 hypothetical protein SmJEL517_g05661 [Synchytrium microbalum]